MARNPLTRIALSAAWLTVCALTLSNSPFVQRAQAQIAGTANESSRTVLADGRMLVAGGSSAAIPLAEAFIEDAAGTRSPLPPMRSPRAGHSATVLADGRVLILGGVGCGGRLQERAEIFDPASGTFNDFDAADVPARSEHSTTLLTDGRLLIAGGRDGSGEAIDTAQVWTSTDGSSLTIPLNGGRSGHVAVLQPDGTVLLKGGGAPSEVYVPGAEVVVAAGAEAIDPPAAFAGSLPQDGAIEVPPDVRIALRFSLPLAAASVGPFSLTLSSSRASVQMAISFAEDGRLLFLTPAAVLAQGEKYNRCTWAAEHRRHTAVDRVDIVQRCCATDADDGAGGRGCGRADPKLSRFSIPRKKRSRSAL